MSGADAPGGAVAPDLLRGPLLTRFSFSVPAALLLCTFSALFVLSVWSAGVAIGAVPARRCHCRQTAHRT